MSFPNANNDDILPDLPFLFNHHMNNMAFPNQFFQYERWTLPSSLKELMLYSAHSFMTNDAINPAVEKLAEYPITEFTFSPITKAAHGTEQYETEIKEKGKIIRIWKDLFDHHQIKSKAITWSLNFYLYGLAAISVYQPFQRSLVCTNCKAQFRLKEIKYKWDSANLQFKGTCKTCMSAVTFKVKDEPIKDAKKVNVISFYPGELEIDYDKTSGCYDVYWEIDAQTIKKIRDGNRLQLENSPKEVIDAVRVHTKKRLPPKVRFHPDNIWLMSRQSADFPDWPAIMGLPITISALRGINHLNMMRRAQTAVLMEHILPFRFIFPQHQDNPSTILDLSDWRKRLQSEIVKWKRDPLYIMLSPVQIGYDQIGGQGKALLLYPEIEQQRLGVIQSLNVPQEFVTGGLSYSGSSVSLRMLENQMSNHVAQVVRAVKWATKRISQISGLEYVEVGMQKFKMGDDIQMRAQLLQMHQAGQISHQYLGEQFGFDWREQMQLIAQEKLERALADAISQAKGMAKLNYLQQLLQQILPPDFNNAYPMVDPGQIDALYQGFSAQDPKAQEAIMAQMEQQNPTVARSLQAKRQQDPMAAFQTMQQMAMDPMNAQVGMMQLQQQDPATQLLLSAMAKQFQMSIFGQGGGGMGGAPGQQPGQPGQNGEAPQGTDMRPSPEQKPPRRANANM